MQDLTSIIESLLFVAEEPLTIDKLAGVLEGFEKKDIRAALEELGETYQNRQGGFYLSEVAGGWQLRTRPEYHEWIKRMLQPSPQRLSKAALETLAIVAYKQPVIRADIEYIRGVDSGGVLRQLMERKLIRVLGRKDIPGRPLIYATTKLFLELFELKDLKDLPSPKEIEQLGGPIPEGPDTVEHDEDTQADAEEMPPPSPETTDEEVDQEEVSAEIQETRIDNAAENDEEALDGPIPEGSETVGPGEDTQAETEEMPLPSPETTDEEVDQEKDSAEIQETRIDNAAENDEDDPAEIEKDTAAVEDAARQEPPPDMADSPGFDSLSPDPSPNNDGPPPKNS